MCPALVGPKISVEWVGGAVGASPTLSIHRQGGHEGGCSRTFTDFEFFASAFKTFPAHFPPTHSLLVTRCLYMYLYTRPTPSTCDPPPLHTVHGLYTSP